MPYSVAGIDALALPAPQDRLYRFGEIDARIEALLAPGAAELDGCDPDAAEIAADGAVPTRQRRILTLTRYRADDLQDRPFGEAALIVDAGHRDGLTDGRRGDARQRLHPPQQLVDEAHLVLAVGVPRRRENHHGRQ